MQRLVKVEFALPCPVNHGAEIPARRGNVLRIPQRLLGDNHKAGRGQISSLPLDRELISGWT